MVSHPYGSMVRSLLIAIVELGVEEVMVIGHTDCGVQGLDPDEMLNRLRKRGISAADIDLIEKSGIDLHRWFQGFESVESSVQATVGILAGHPRMPKDAVIRGFVMDSVSGELRAV